MLMKVCFTKSNLCFSFFFFPGAPLKMWQVRPFIPLAHTDLGPDWWCHKGHRYFSWVGDITLGQVLAPPSESCLLLCLSLIACQTEPIVHFTTVGVKVLLHPLAMPNIKVMIAKHLFMHQLWPQCKFHGAAGRLCFRMNMMYIIQYSLYSFPHRNPAADIVLPKERSNKLL